MSRADQSAEAFMLHRARPVALATLRNLRSVRDLPYAFGGEVYAHDAVICGAGPSLTAALPMIRDTAATVYTVNTAAKAVGAVRTPDVVVVREIVDCAPHLVPAHEYVLDIGVNPGVLARARELAPRVSWFVPAGVHLFGLAASLEVEPLYGGSAALTAACALAIARGATRLGLCGVDLAYSDDGLAYARGSAYDGQRVELDAQGRARATGEGAELQHAQHDRAGVVRHPEVQATVEVPAYGGHGTRRALLTWEDQRQWLSRLAAQRCIGHVLGQGARIDGAIECAEIGPRAQGLYAGEWRLPTVPASAWLALDTSVRQQIATARAWASALSARTPVLDVPHTIDGSDVVEAIVSGRLIRLREAPVPIGERLRGLAALFERGAEEAAEAWCQP